jgi:hypothetical protein
VRAASECNLSECTQGWRAPERASFFLSTDSTHNVVPKQLGTLSGSDLFLQVMSMVDSDEVVFAWAIAKASLIVVASFSSLVYVAWAGTHKAKWEKAPQAFSTFFAAVFHLTAGKFELNDTGRGKSRESRESELVGSNPARESVFS